MPQDCLVEISIPERGHRTNKFAITQPLSPCPADGVMANTDYWLGLTNPSNGLGTNAALDGKMIWSDGTSYTYDVAFPNVEANQESYCVKFRHTYGKLETASCGTYYPSICEYECGNGGFWGFIFRLVGAAVGRMRASAML